MRHECENCRNRYKEKGVEGIYCKHTNEYVAGAVRNDCDLFVPFLPEYMFDEIEVDIPESWLKEDDGLSEFVVNEDDAMDIMDIKPYIADKEDEVDE